MGLFYDFFHIKSLRKLVDDRNQTLTTYVIDIEHYKKDAEMASSIIADRDNTISIKDDGLARFKQELDLADNRINNLLNSTEQLSKQTVELQNKTAHLEKQLAPYSEDVTSLRYKLEQIFPDEPFVINGYWSWAGTKIDFVFPELMLFDVKLNKWVASGLAIHISRKDDFENTQRLFTNSVKSRVPLLVLDENQIPEVPDLIRRIEKVYENKLTVPKAPKPKE